MAVPEGRQDDVNAGSPPGGGVRGARRLRSARRLAAFAGVVAVLAVTLAPATVAAVDALAVTTPYPAVSVAPGSKASFDLTVTTLQAERVDLAISGVPEGWTAQLNGGGHVVTAVLADPKATTPTTVRLDVKVPADAAAKSYQLLVTGTSGSQKSDLPIDIVVNTAAGGDVTMTTDYPSLEGPSTTSFTFNLTLHNDTAQDLTFGVNAKGPEGWTTTAKPSSQSQASTFQVNAGDTAGITVTADPPTEVAAGSYPVEVTATSGDKTVGGALTVKITGQFSMAMTTPDGRLNANGAAGSTIPRSLLIQNTGTAPLTNVTMTETLPTGWKVTYDPAGPIANIAANSSATVTANIVPASNAIAGDYVATFRASSPDATGGASSDIRVTVETPLNWLLVGAGIIVLALLGLGFVFSRYGRR